jgi:hypothetical protein
MAKVLYSVRIRMHWFQDHTLFFSNLRERFLAHLQFRCPTLMREVQPPSLQTHALHTILDMPLTILELAKAGTKFPIRFGMEEFTTRFGMLVAMTTI